MSKYEKVKWYLGGTIKRLKKPKMKYKCKNINCYGGLKPIKLNADGNCPNCAIEDEYNLFDFVNGKAVNTQKGGV